MAKSSNTRSRRSNPTPQQHADVEPQEVKESKPAAGATAVAEAPTPPPAPETRSGGTGEDVSAIDAETNAKYEQVKGGKLYIKDLQQKSDDLSRDVVNRYLHWSPPCELGDGC